jgi:arsenite-transporting ATPase
VAWLDTVVPPSVRVLLVCGKGGVGKTTCAAAIALALADASPDRRVLALSVDHAHSLGDALATPLGDDEGPVRDGPEGLRARELDAARAFAERRERYRDSVDELFDALRGGSRFDASVDRAVLRDLIDLAPPGTDELFAILSVVDALGLEGGEGGYDVVVVDTAPTGHALRLLDLPATALEWVRAFLAVLLKYREITGLGDLAADLVSISRRLRAFQALVHDPRRARAVAVTRPGELPRLETARLLRGLRRLDIAVSAVVVNAVTRAACEVCRRLAAGEMRELEALRVPAPIVVGPAVQPPPQGVAALRAWGRSLAVERRRPAPRTSRVDRGK